jgi:hypothetical protein
MITPIYGLIQRHIAIFGQMAYSSFLLENKAAGDYLCFGITKQSLKEEIHAEPIVPNGSNSGPGAYIGFCQVRI